MTDQDALYQRGVALGKVSRCAHRHYRRRRTTEAYMVWLAADRRAVAAWVDYHRAIGLFERAQDAPRE